MKLLTKQLKKRFDQVGSQERKRDPLVIAKFFDPVGTGTWYATEYYQDGQVFFGYVSIFGDWNDEWGFFSLSELEGIRGPLGMGIERDLYFSEKPISEVEPKAVLSGS